jgi:hypothetical protein
LIAEPRICRTTSFISSSPRMEQSARFPPLKFNGTRPHGRQQERPEAVNATMMDVSRSL